MTAHEMPALVVTTQKNCLKLPKIWTRNEQKKKMKKNVLMATWQAFITFAARVEQAGNETDKIFRFCT